jgi:hypothetical protein
MVVIRREEDVVGSFLSVEVLQWQLSAVIKIDVERIPQVESARPIANPINRSRGLDV